MSHVADVADVPVLDLPDNAIWLSDRELAEATEDELALLTHYWRTELHKRDPVAWGGDVLREFWWSAQRDIAYAVLKHRKVAVRSCHEAGKDFIAARIACHWIQTGVPGKRAVVTTAASGVQVKAILWKEINQAHKKGRLIGRTNLTEWYVDGEIVGLGRKVADYNPTSFHGIHAPEGVLVIYDEACGINEELFQAGNSMAGNEKSRQLAIGNPDNPDSYFAKLFMPESEWHPIHIDGYETPNFTGEAVPAELASSLIDHSYVDGLIKEYGEDSPVFISKVRGSFPSDSKDGVVPWSKLAACRYVPEDRRGAHDLGVDVAASEEGDGDATVIYERWGNAAMGQWVVNSSESDAIVGKVMEVLRVTHATRVKIDSIGVGWGVVGHLKALGKEGEHSAQIIGVNVAERSNQPHRFMNLRSQIWWEVARETTLNGGWSLADVDDRTLADLIAPRYFLNAKGLTVVEPKAETKKRLKRSPDKADALNLAYFEPFPHSKARLTGRQIAAVRIGV